MTLDKCMVCGRPSGHKATNRFGERDVNPDTPLGPLRGCAFCGTAKVCPDCWHELDCCELAEEKAEA